jgi:CRP-like cAMP-binding protein
MMDKFRQTISQFCPLDKESLEELEQALKPKSFKKGDFLLKGDEICNYFYFLEKGLVKIFFDTGDKSFIMTFFKENNFFTELSSFNTGKPSKYMLTAIEPVELKYIDRNTIENLCRKYHCIETLFKKLNANATIGMMSRISEMLEDDGKKRYENFLSHSGDLMQRISLGDLSDYIGITQVSLSRIRAQK